MIEAELKALVRDPQALTAALDARAPAERATYSDTYYDTPARDLTGTDRELRVRIIDREGLRHCRLSKPEHETSVGDPAVFATLFRGLGLQVLVELTKHCANYRLDHGGYRMLATVVSVPELADTFVEVETQVPAPGDVPPALQAIQGLLAELGIGASDLNSRDYTDMIQEARGAT